SGSTPQPKYGVNSIPVFALLGPEICLERPTSRRAGGGAVRPPRHAMFSASSVIHSEPGRPCWADIVTSKLGTTRVEAVRGEDGFFGQLALWNLGYLRVAHVKLRGAAVRGMRRRTIAGRQSFSWLAASLSGGFELNYTGRSSVL